MDNLIAALPGTTIPILKSAFTPQTAGQWFALFNIAGIPGAAALPSSGVAGDVPVDSTAGGFPFTNPTPPALTYLGRLAASATTIGTLYLYDRLWQNSGLSVTSTGAQTVQATTPTVPLTRPDANGAGVEAWLQIYATMGAGSPTATIAYTDQDGNTAQTGNMSAVNSASTLGRCYPIPLAAGDTGVRSIQTFTASATFTSGTHGLVLRRQLTALSLPITAGGQAVDPIQLGLPRIYDDACLEFVFHANAASACTLTGYLTMISG